jgi:hypothetical protein
MTGVAELCLSISGCNSQSLEYRVQIQVTARIEESAQCRLDDGALTRFFVERKVA